MTTLTMTTFVTLDGVMQAPGGPDEDRDGGFACGGWLFPFWDDLAGRFMDDVMGRADAFLLGRRTYEIFAGYWPHHDDPSDPVAGALNHRPKYVASRTLERADWQHTTIVRDVVAEVTRLKQQPGRELQVHGSATLAQTLLEHRLVDVFNVLTFPVVVGGGGKRLFGAGTVPTGLQLVASKVTGKGVVISTYRNAGQPTFATVGA